MAIGAAVTANARIYMTQFKNNPDLKLYYSDTDSIFTDKPLPDYLVNETRLGSFKLEKVFTLYPLYSPDCY